MGHPYVSIGMKRKTFKMLALLGTKLVVLGEEGKTKCFVHSGDSRE